MAMNEQLGWWGRWPGQADVLTNIMTLDQSCLCTDSSISLLAPAEVHLQSMQSTHVKRLDALEAAQYNGNMEQSAPEGAHRPLS